MRFHAKSVLSFSLLCLLAVPAAPAQEQEKENQGRSNGSYVVTRQASALKHKTPAPRPLTRHEGLAILRVALDVPHSPYSPSDCSHLVHALYERAGFPYEYAPSSDLYVGIDEFRRVAKPQPGDLAVWRGHAGIVVNPGQHSFFSMLSSGPGVDSYNSRYWKQRGRPRFFRYIKRAPSLSSPIQTASLSRNP